MRKKFPYTIFYIFDDIDFSFSSNIRPYTLESSVADENITLSIFLNLGLSLFLQAVRVNDIAMERE